MYAGYQEVCEDLDEKRQLALALLTRLKRFTRGVELLSKKYRLPSTHVLLLQQAEDFSARATFLVDVLSSIIAHPPTDETTFTHALELKQSSLHTLRTLHSELAYLMSTLDWQSPTFADSVFGLAGLQDGKIIGQTNDYKRDVHLDVDSYEREFLRAYIDAPAQLPPHIVMTSSGMSALATMLMTLHTQYPSHDPILMGRGSYFQNQWLVDHRFTDKIITFDEQQTDHIVDLVKKHHPKFVFLDTLSNTESIPCPSLSKLLPQLSEMMSRKSAIVLDNSILGPTFQPLRYYSRLRAKPDLFVFESLNKYYQFGMDRVTGGIVWSPTTLSKGLHTARMHMGTILTDASTHALPTPNRALLEKRLARIGRNALFLAQHLYTYTQTHKTSIKTVHYPGLPHHPSFDASRSFHGPFMTLAFKRTIQPRHFESFISHALQEAKVRHIPLVAGTSFGMDTTRLYLTALHADKYVSPFIRISVGTETLPEMEKMAELFETLL